MVPNDGRLEATRSKGPRSSKMGIGNANLDLSSVARIPLGKAHIDNTAGRLANSCANLLLQRKLTLPLSHCRKLFVPLRRFQLFVRFMLKRSLQHALLRGPVAKIKHGFVEFLGADLLLWNVEFDKGTGGGRARSEEHTSELPSLMRISYAVFCL